MYCKAIYEMFCVVIGPILTFTKFGKNVSPHLSLLQNIEARDEKTILFVRWSCQCLKNETVSVRK